MQTRRWINQTQPQTLVIAVFLLYFTAAFVFLGNGPDIGAALGNINNYREIENFGRLFVAAGGIYAGYAISNDQKLGYYIGIAVAALPLVAKLIICVRFKVSPLDARFDLVDWLFDIAMFALLVHEQSRNYVRIWFK